jgi:hypothetical protein
MKNTHLEDPPRRTLVNPHCLVQRVVERGVVVSDFLPQRLLGLGLVKVGRWRTGMPLLLPGRATATSGACRPAHDDEASAPCVGCCGITQPSSRISSTPTAGSGAGVGQFSHWPHLGGGASSSGISTTAARSPVVGTGASATVELPLLWLPPQPLPPAATPWPQPCRAMAHSSPPPVALSTSSASSAQTRPT